MVCGQDADGLQRCRPGVQRTGLATSGDSGTPDFQGLADGGLATSGELQPSRGSRRGAQIIFPSFLKKTKINAFDANMPKCRKRIQKER